jgi:hypothetical protein
MHGEFSRLTYDPRKHVAGVLQQQGRVGLDADWNEWVEAVLRRLRVETLDVIGGCGQPKHAPGFEVTITQSGTPNASLELSAGRLYAGGLLAELEQKTDISQQIDWPIPPSREAQWKNLLPKFPWPGLDLTGLKPGQRRDLIYAEAWLRDITALIDEAERDQTLADTKNNPDWNARPEVGDLLRERALGGPDTCTRIRTIAQVKLWTITDDKVTDCEEAYKALKAALPPGTIGRLQVNVQPSPPVKSPCDEPQLGGYAGAENRTYRVEIHTPTDPSDSKKLGTFKYSTENGAFCVRIQQDAWTKIAKGSNITIDSIGRDQVTQLKKDDWVEVCGEETELGMFRNDLAQVAANPVALANGLWQIQLTGDVIIPGAPFLRRWSGQDQTIALGTPFKLDDGSGLSITFSGPADPAEGNPFFHAQDYWIWAARVRTRDIEPATLENSPQRPRGTERFYCVLSIVTWTGDGSGNITGDSDPCDHEFPPLTELLEGCCCVITVGDGKTTHGTVDRIQDAFDILPKEGGTICIERGNHILDKPIQIPRGNILIKGCGSETVIDARNGAFVLNNRPQIAIVNLMIKVAEQPALRARQARNLKFLDNTIEVKAGASIPALSLQGRAIEVERNSFSGAGIEILSASQDIWLRRNSIQRGSQAGITITSTETEAQAAITRIEISDNLIFGMDAEAIICAGPGVSGRIPVPLVISELKILRNVMTQCLQRAGRKIGDIAPAAVMIVGGRHINLVGNTIEDNGPKIRASGVAISLASEINLERNRIQNNGHQENEDTAERAAAFYALMVPSLAARNLMDLEGWPALVLKDNVASATGVPALWAVGTGRFMISGNQLISQTSELSSGKVVRIFNYGVGDTDFVPLDDDFRPNVQAPSETTEIQGTMRDPRLLPLQWLSGDVLFAENQVRLENPAQLAQAALAPPSPPERVVALVGSASILAEAVTSAITMQSCDDICFSDNQVRCLGLGNPGTLLRSQSARAVNNRFTDPFSLGRTTSCYGVAGLMTATSNQATHCLVFRGEAAVSQLNLISAQNRLRCVEFMPAFVALERQLEEGIKEYLAAVQEAAFHDVAKFDDLITALKVLVADFQRPQPRTDLLQLYGKVLDGQGKPAPAGTKVALREDPNTPDDTAFPPVAIGGDGYVTISFSVTDLLKKFPKITAPFLCISDPGGKNLFSFPQKIDFQDGKVILFCAVIG